jgi:formylglycine-generating enzyme required for sulfatase activity
MKYEISQSQYADFLNCLTYQQQKARTAVSPASASGALAMTQFAPSRNGIRVQVPGSDNVAPSVYGVDGDNDAVFYEDGDGYNRAANFLAWADVAAYLDWAALRPLTELEFEKACRGPIASLPLEFAWGTPNIVDANTIEKDGTPEEHTIDSVPPGYGLASHGYDGPQGPLRCGFAATASSNRLQAGASYYGIMELSGNLWEQTVNLTRKGLQYEGAHGDGLLTSEGEADVPNWPGKDALGAGYRGGGWYSGILAQFRDLAVSDRFYIYLKPDTRRNTSGGRGGRLW